MPQFSNSPKALKSSMLLLCSRHYETFRFFFILLNFAPSYDPRYVRTCKPCEQQVLWRMEKEEGRRSRGGGCGVPGSSEQTPAPPSLPSPVYPSLTHIAHFHDEKFNGVYSSQIVKKITFAFFRTKFPVAIW